MKKLNQYRAGFTLLEMVVVLGCICIIGAIAIPEMGKALREDKAREEAQRVQMEAKKAQERQERIDLIKDALKQFAEEQASRGHL